MKQMPKREMEVLTPQMYYVLLVLHQPMHGYEIMNEITKITNGEITVGAGTLYTLLPKFEKDFRKDRWHTSIPLQKRVQGK